MLELSTERCLVTKHFGAAVTQKGALKPLFDYCLEDMLEFKHKL